MPGKSVHLEISRPKEFVPDCVGFESGFRDATAPSAKKNYIIPVFLEMGFDRDSNRTN
ncbi:MAG: hypothetical protein ACR2OZ_06330 [Verrucomicrobiales bacterium]